MKQVRPKESFPEMRNNKLGARLRPGIRLLAVASSTEVQVRLWVSKPDASLSTTSRVRMLFSAGPKFTEVEYRTPALIWVCVSPLGSTYI